MAQITYANKSTMNTNSSIPAINKCQASDMNEIKTVVNGNYTELYNDIYYKDGDTYTSSGAHDIAGIISGNSAVVGLDLVVPKRLDNITSVTCTNLTGVLMGYNGYLSNITSNINYASTSGYSLTCSIVSPNRVRLRIQKSSAWTNVVNNSVISSIFNTINLTFHS